MMKRIISLMAVFAALVIVNMQMAEAYSVVDYFAGGSSYSLAADSNYIYSQSGKFNNDGTYAAAGAIPGGNSFGPGYSEWGDTFYRASGKNIMGYNKSTGLLTSTLNTSGLMYHTIHGLTTDGTDFYTSQFHGYGATSKVTRNNKYTRIVEDFCSYSRRGSRRIAELCNCATTTQNSDKKTSYRSSHMN